MKYLLMLLLTFGGVMAASAQHYDRDDYYGHRRRGASFEISIGTSPYGYNGNNYNDRDYRIERINREFNRRIWEVRSDYSLSPWEKRRIIRDLEIRRDERINEILRWQTRRW